MAYEKLLPCYGRLYKEEKIVLSQSQSLPLSAFEQVTNVVLTVV
jgi:hypothetical protein